MIAKSEFNGSLEHAEVMFDGLAGLEGRYQVKQYMPDTGLWVSLMLPESRRSAFHEGQTFYSVGVADPSLVAGRRWWYWAEELVVKGPKRKSDNYGGYLHYDFFSRGAVWSGINPGQLQRPTISAA